MSPPHDARSASRSPSALVLAPFGAKVRRLERILVWLAVLVLVVASTASCAVHYDDLSTQELIAIVQRGEFDSARGSGPACDAAYNLGLRRATEAVDALIAALSGQAVDCMALALGQIGDPRAVEPLLGALGESGGPSGDFFDEDKMPFDSADEALVAIGAPAVEPLLAIADSGDEDTRDLATYVLGRIGDARAGAFLLERFKEPSATLLPMGQLEADALARIFGDQIDRLLPLLQSKETVAIAYGLVGLGRAGTEAALSEALMQFGDESLAEFYLNAGNPELHDAALDWALANGYELALPTGIPGDTEAPPGWGDIGDGLD
jgi:PBS lyase HEAT-like repeat